MRKNPLKIFIYSRKSVYTGKGESIDNQIEMCREYISSKIPGSSDAEISIYEDEGFSAKNTDRPQFQKMLFDLKQDKPDYVICYRLDRISRNVSDFSSFVEELNNLDISFVCIKEEFDTSTPMGKAMMYIASVFAQLERETIAERVRDNMLMLARTGRWLGGTTPTGFTSEKTQEVILDGKIKTAYKLKDNPEELKIVDCIFEKFLELRSLSGVSKHLIKQDIKSRTGKYYSLLGIKDILQNPVYCIADETAREYFTSCNSDVCFERKDCSKRYGLLAYNKRDYRKKNAPRQSMDKWIIAIGKHKGRISGKKWVSVQNILKDNIPTGTKPAVMHNDYALLSGLITCKQCQSRMFAKRRSSKGHNQTAFDYICSNKLRGGTALCNCKNLNGMQADDLVCEHLCNFAKPSYKFYHLLEELKCKLQAQEQDDPIADIDKKIDHYTKEIDHFINILSQGAASPSVVKKVNLKVSALDDNIASLKTEKTAREQELSLTSEQELQIDMLSTTLASFNDHFDILTIQEKRTLIKLIVKKIVWDGTALHIFIDGD